MEVTTKQLAEIFRNTTKTIQNWQKQGMPTKSKGGRGVAAKFELIEVITWWSERECSRRLSGDEETEFFDRNKEEARLKHHQANNEEIKEQKERGELLPTRLVIELCSAGVLNCRDRLMVADKKLRNEFPGASEEIFNRLSALIEDALFQLGEQGIPSGLAERV